MKKIAIIASALVLSWISAASITSAQGMMGVGQMSAAAASAGKADDHTAREEIEGKEIWAKLQSKQTVCKDINEGGFAALGEYFMGLMLGETHSAMNGMMTRTTGEEGEAAMHAVMGKRLSGCDTSAAFPVASEGWIPMMNMMWGGWSSPFGSNSTNNMMNFGFGSFGSCGGVFMILWWILIVAGIVALIKWLVSQSGGGSSKSALNILKERYARGEITKNQFEEIKKDLD